MPDHRETKQCRTTQERWPITLPLFRTQGRQLLDGSSLIPNLVESDAPVLDVGQRGLLYLGSDVEPKVIPCLMRNVQPEAAHYLGSDGDFVTSNATRNIHQLQQNQLLDLLGIQTKLLPIC